jgi:hypothetical protein
LSQEELEEWITKRKRMGTKKYGDAHKKRYTLLDEMEEVLDLEDIHRKGGEDRILKYALEQDELKKRYIMNAYDKVREKADELKEAIMVLDRMLPDKVCTDERGGERIGW